MKPQSSSSRLLHRLPLLLIVLAVVVSMGNVVTLEFTWWDDVFNVWQNPRLNPPTVRGVLEYWPILAGPDARDGPINHAYGLYIPLTYTTWGLLASVAQVSEPDPYGATLNPAIFHAANLILHMLAALVVFQILHLLLKRTWPACVGALLWALHPVQVEPVAWVAGLKDVQAGLLGLVAIWQFLRFRGAGSEIAPPTITSRWHYPLDSLALVGAMLSKPSAVVVPAIVLAIDWLILRRPLQQSLIALWPWLVLSVVFAVIARLAQPALIVPPPPIHLRPLIAADALAFYLHKLIWPVQLAVDYGRRPDVVMGQGWFYLTWIAPAAVAVVLWRVRHRHREVAVAGLVFVLGVAPVLGLVTFLFQYHSTVADHYLYPAMLGPALALGYAMTRLTAWPWIILAAIFLTVLGIRSMLQTRVWYDDYTLFGHAVRVNPQSPAGWSNLGHRYMRDHQYAQAEAMFRRSIEARPDFWNGWRNLAASLVEQGRAPETIPIIEHLIAAQLAVEPRYRLNVADDYNRLGALYLDLNRPADAVEPLRRALEIDPGHVQARRNLLEAMELLQQSSGPADG